MLDLGGLVGGDLTDVVAGVVLVGQGHDQRVAVRLLGQLKNKAIVKLAALSSSAANVSDNFHSLGDFTLNQRMIFRNSFN